MEGALFADATDRDAKPWEEFRIVLMMDLLGLEPIPCQPESISHTLLTHAETMPPPTLADNQALSSAPDSGKFASSSYAGIQGILSGIKRQTGLGLRKVSPFDFVTRLRTVVDWLGSEVDYTYGSLV